MTDILFWYAMVILTGVPLMVGLAIGFAIGSHVRLNEAFDAYEKTRRGW